MASVAKPPPVPMVMECKDEWMEAAYKGMDALIARGVPFTADSLRDLVPVPRHPNWVGAVFTAYREHGFIRPLGYEQSRARSRRSGVLRRWAVVTDARR